MSLRIPAAFFLNYGNVSTPSVRLIIKLLTVNIAIAMTAETIVEIIADSPISTTSLSSFRTSDIIMVIPNLQLHQL